ncbi:MAG: permease-like cell division protein FtsX [Oscillospiraceae bacterium]|jgi:cell division transport system permease protein|nr:permease-like cell division protein FtsX [Oscillospiraceae bacterium]
MKQNNFGYLVHEGVRSLFRHGFTSFAAICITAVCLVIFGCFGMIAYNLGLLLDDLQAESRVLVFVDENYSQAEAKSVGSQINLMDNVADAVFVSREEAFAKFLAQNEDDEVYEGVEAATLRDQFEITLIDNSKMDETIAALRGMQGVAKVNAQTGVVNRLLTLQTFAGTAAAVVAPVLLLVSLVIIFNTIKLAMLDRREEIAIMRMVGATKQFIRLPFVVEGLLLGLFGSILSFFVLWGVYDLIRNAIAASLDFMSLIPFTQMLIPVAMLCGGIGLFIGVLGSLMSIRKFLKV